MCQQSVVEITAWALALPNHGSRKTTINYVEQNFWFHVWWRGIASVEKNKISSKGKKSLHFLLYYHSIKLVLCKYGQSILYSERWECTLQNLSEQELISLVLLPLSGGIYNFYLAKSWLKALCGLIKSVQFLCFICKGPRIWKLIIFMLLLSS